MLNTRQAAKQLGITREAISQMFHKGKFPGAYQIDDRGPIRIPESDVEALKRQPWKAAEALKQTATSSTTVVKRPDCPKEAS